MPRLPSPTSQNSQFLKLKNRMGISFTQKFRSDKKKMNQISVTFHVNFTRVQNKENSGGGDEKIAIPVF